MPSVSDPTPSSHENPFFAEPSIDGAVPERAQAARRGERGKTPPGGERPGEYRAPRRGETLPLTGENGTIYFSVVCSEADLRRFALRQTRGG